MGTERLDLGGAGQAPVPPLRRTPGGLPVATPENLAGLLARPQPPPRVWWKKAEMELCLVPAGEFILGIGEEEARRWHKEFGGELKWYMDAVPDHRVYLDAFYIGRYPVTNAGYARFVTEAGHRVPFEREDWAKPYNWDRERRVPPPGKEAHPVVLGRWGRRPGLLAGGPGCGCRPRPSGKRRRGRDFQIGRKRLIPGETSGMRGRLTLAKGVRAGPRRLALTARRATARMAARTWRATRGVGGGPVRRRLLRPVAGPQPSRAGIWEIAGAARRLLELPSQDRPRLLSATTIPSTSTSSSASAWSRPLSSRWFLVSGYWFLLFRFINLNPAEGGSPG